MFYGPVLAQPSRKNVPLCELCLIHHLCGLPCTATDPRHPNAQTPMPTDSSNDINERRRVAYARTKTDVSAKTTRHGAENRSAVNAPNRADHALSCFVFPIAHFLLDYRDIRCEKQRCARLVRLTTSRVALLFLTSHVVSFLGRHYFFLCSAA